MGPVEQRVMQLLEPTVEAMGYELLGIEYQAQGRNALLRLYIDADNGISLGDCEKVSHQVSGVLDVEDPVRGQYRLEVSSPGVDRPLFKLAHFARFKGESVKLRLYHAVEGQRNFKGEIEDVKGNDIYISMEGDQSLVCSLDEIEKAHLVPRL